ncbi:MAG: hypothetical protein Q4F11_09795, partial [Eubacteriales bacterium]|nr:hypothetical protein [Eubacteriales bacterium]
MAINLSNYLNGSGQLKQQVNNSSDSAAMQILKNAGNTSAVSDSSTGNLLLKNMLAGETFTGLVLGVKGSQVSLAMGDKTTLTASLYDNVQLQTGQTVTFIVEENNNNHIKIKPMETADQQAFIINKALEGAGLPLTKDNILIIKELFSLNMPVSAEKITEMIHLATAFPDSDYHTLANMLRLEIPVTQENIIQ